MKKRAKIVFAFTLLAISLCLTNNTYSRYIADSNGDVDIEFAKWQILVNYNDITDGNNAEMTFTPTIEPNENIAQNYIAPSSKGYFDIDIDHSNVDVSFNYTITLDIENEEIPDLMVTKYAVIDSTYDETKGPTYLEIKDNKISNDIIHKVSEDKKFTIRVYFEWYEGQYEFMNEIKNETMDDEADTIIGNKAANDEEIKFNINANISFKQII